MKMKIFTAVMILLVITKFSPVAQEMSSFGSAAKWPLHSYTMRQASSYDRRSANHPDAPGWFADDDHDQFIRKEEHDGRRVTTAGSKITLIIDVSSVELFADEGLTVMTEIFFPHQPYDRVYLTSKDGIIINQLKYAGLKSIWD